MKTTEQKNRLIAEFMGMQLTDIGWFDNEEVLKLSHTMDNTFDELLFHTSWDWLMPVIGEVKYSAGESDEITDVLDRIDSGLLGRNIEYTFNYVVEFIEWYNNQK